MQLILRRKLKLSSIIIICIVVMSVLVCLRLSVWQWHRAEQKQQQLSDIAAQQQLGVLNWQQLQRLDAEQDKTGLTVAVTSRLNPEKYWLLDNQIVNGQVGYDVLTIVKQGHDSVLVNLGWVKAPFLRSELPTVKWPSSPLSMHIQLKQGNLQGYTLAENMGAEQGWPKRVQTIDLTQMAQQYGESILPFMGYRLGAADQLATPHYKAVVMSPQKHYGYAVQWLLIALACVLVAYFASKRRSKNEN